MGFTAESIALFLRGVHDLSAIRMKDAAEHKGWSISKLQRRLTREGTSYHELLDAERKRRCSDLLAINPHADSALVCKKTGLKRQHMSKRFKAWMGVTLMEYNRGISL